MMPKLVHEGDLEVMSVDDCGQAVITEIISDDSEPAFFRFQSWDPDKNHETINNFIGRKVRITIETLD
jgi:hypothetical protein